MLPTLLQRADNLFPMGYKAELDTNKPLDQEEASYYQSIIWVMKWMVEIGRIGIDIELSLLPSHLAYHRKEHMEGALHIMSYLQQKHNYRLVFNPTFPII